MATNESNRDIDFLKDVTLEVRVEFGRCSLTLKEMLRLKKGKVLELDRMIDQPLEIRVNGNLVARGEAVVVNDSYGIRVTEIVSPEEVSLLEGAQGDVL